MSRSVRRCAVLGSPIAHSLSPALHRAAYRQLGLPWTYEAVEVGEDGLAGFLAGLDGSWRGLSLTMPLKRVALGCVDEATTLARQVGAVNTVLLGDGYRRGDNTDVPGIVAALAAHGTTSVRSASVLGGGATARSAVAALASLTGPNGLTSVYARDPARAAPLVATADAVGSRCEVRPWAERSDALSAPLVVAATPAAGVADLTGRVPAAPGILFDVSYHPWPTPLAAAWARVGGRVIGGLDLLVHQAVLQVLLMTELDAPTEPLADVMAAAGRQALAARGAATPPR